MGDPITTFWLKVFFFYAPDKFCGAVPRPVSELTGSMVYPYYQFVKVFSDKNDDYIKSDLKTAFEYEGSKMPIFLGYGADKPTRFHSDKFARTLLDQPNCAVKGYNSGHWVMHEKS